MIPIKPATLILELLFETGDLPAEPLKKRDPRLDLVAVPRTHSRLA
ncbi:MAG: hypothetical protein U1E76_25460 [Planctomycetota bacterium]